MTTHQKRVEATARALTPDDCRKCPSFTVLANEVDRLRSELEDAEATIALLREDTAFIAAAVRAKWQECEATFGLYYDGAVQEFMRWLDEQEQPRDPEHINKPPAGSAPWTPDDDLRRA